ncbi:MAG TPA: hypothetical protein VF344_06405, partial [Candidatus Limnocylindrales bacterium]
ILSLPELIERFELSSVNKAGSIFDRERLEWINGQWIRRLSVEDLIERLRPFFEIELAAGRIEWLPSDDEIRALLPVVQERLPRLSAVGELIGFLFVNDVDPDPAIIVPKRWNLATTVTGLAAARATIAETGKTAWDAHAIEAPLRQLVEDRGWKAGDLFMSIRVAVTGRTATPPLFDTMVALGYEQTLARLDRAVEKLEAVAAGR